MLIRPGSLRRGDARRQSSETALESRWKGAGRLTPTDLRCGPCGAANRAVTRRRISSKRRRFPPGGMRETDRVENAQLRIRRRERKQQKFKSQDSAQRFLACLFAVCRRFNSQPHRIS